MARLAIALAAIFVFAIAVSSVEGKITKVSKKAFHGGLRAAGKANVGKLHNACFKFVATNGVQQVRRSQQADITTSNFDGSDNKCVDFSTVDESPAILDSQVFDNGPSADVEMAKIQENAGLQATGNQNPYLTFWVYSKDSFRTRRLLKIGTSDGAEDTMANEATRWVGKQIKKIEKETSGFQWSHIRLWHFHVNTRGKGNDDVGRGCGRVFDIETLEWLMRMQWQTANREEESDKDHVARLKTCLSVAGHSSHAQRIAWFIAGNAIADCGEAACNN